MNLDKYGTGDESTLVKWCPNDSEFLELDAKLVKVGLKRSKIYIAMNPLFGFQGIAIRVTFSSCL